MPTYSITKPRPDVIRVAFPRGWNAQAESAAMFKDLVAVLDVAGDPVTLMIVAGRERPIYEPHALKDARGVLYHDNIKRMFIVAEDAQLAVNHMSATRAERGFPPLLMLAFDTEEEALKHL
jgi:hypothetical protein